MADITIDELRDTFGFQIDKLVANTNSTENAINSIKDVLFSIVKSVEDTKYLIAQQVKKDKDDTYQQRDEKKIFSNLVTTLKTNTSELQEQNKREKDRDKKQTSLFSKIFGPISLVLTTVAALGFGLTRFPALRKFISNTTGNLFGNVLNIAQGMLGKEKSLKDFIKNIPIVGYLVHVYDAFKFFALGKYAEGIKELAFNIPGIDFIAPLFGTTRLRLMDKSARTGNKPEGVFRFNIEDTLDATIEKVDTFLKPIGDFFNNAIDFTKSLYFAVTKGDYESISKSLNSLATLFPILKGAAAFTSGMLFKQFEIAESRQGEGGKLFSELNLFDVAKDLYKRTSSSIANLFNDIMTPIQNIMKAIGLVFSGDLSKQRAGFALLDIYFPNISTGLKVILGSIDRINKIKQSSGGKVPLWKLMTTDIDIGQYDAEANPEMYDKKAGLENKITKLKDFYGRRKKYEEEMDSLYQQSSTLKEQINDLLQNKLKVSEEEAYKNSSDYRDLVNRKKKIDEQYELMKRFPVQNDVGILGLPGGGKDFTKTAEETKKRLGELNLELEQLTGRMRYNAIFNEDTLKVLSESKVDLNSISQSIASGREYFTGEFAHDITRDIADLQSRAFPEPNLTPIQRIDRIQEDTVKGIINSPILKDTDFNKKMDTLNKFLQETLDKQLELSQQQQSLQTATMQFLREKAASSNIFYTQYNPTNNVVAAHLSPTRAQRIAYVSDDVTNR